MNIRIAATLAALMVSATGASAATVGLQAVTIDGEVQTFLRSNGNLITLWEVVNTAGVGLGTGNVEVTQATDILSRFFVMGGSVVELYNGTNPVNAGASEFSEITYSFIVPPNTTPRSSIWVEWTGDLLLYLNPNFSVTGVSGDFITDDGDPVPVVPLPAGLPLLLAGLGAIGLAARRRKAA
jgi:hypothetical protein